ncbi:Protein scarlet [Camponotus floridanus]|uniref:Protein scarlet n=2 Tax=Camponotus floridanus TaxID=104421 RepID=E2A9Q8_CAMFO|nr:Protein scarlet [Camponotus floridanus]
MTSQLSQLFWENLTVSVSVKDDACSGKVWCKFSSKKCVSTFTILKGVSGYAETSNMFAILGPSGAGKTTFLAALARRLKLTSGTVKINGHDISKETMAEISSYMPQFDALPSALTPREYMSFVCALKMESNCSALGRKSLAEQLLRDLALNECIDTLISKLSGGEKKRLSLATELVTQPKIFFLDEPTTGLDTFAATCVVQSLKLIASRGTIIFCTIHQPGMTIYNAFSHVLLMADGRSIYFGTLENATDFFKSQDYHCPINYDESEYYVNILSRRNRSETTDRNIELYRAFWQSSLSKIPTVENTKTIFRIVPRKKSGWFVQFYWLLWRIFLQDIRTVSDNWIAWFSFSLSAIFVGIFYIGANSSTQEGIQSVRGALYLMISEIIFTVAYSVIYEIPGGLVLYLRESTVYAPGPYYVATILGLIPKAIFKALLFTIVIYFLLHLEFRLIDLCFYCFCTMTTAICGIAYGMMTSSWITNVDIVTAIMVPLDLLLLLMAGVFYNLRTLPIYLTYFKYMSMFYYSTEALSIIHWSKIKNIDCPINRDLPCLSNGTEVLTEYGYNEGNFWWDMVGLLLLIILMNVVGYFGTKRRRESRSII